MRAPADAASPKGLHRAGGGGDPVALARSACGPCRPPGRVGDDPPCEPKNPASPKLKIPPSDATNQYPRPDGVAAIPTIGRFNGIAPIEPKNPASPKLKIPPSDATNQYPRPDGVAAIPTIGRFNRIAPIEPKNPASPKLKIPPSDATNQ